MELELVTSLDVKEYFSRVLKLNRKRALNLFKLNTLGKKNKKTQKTSAQINLEIGLELINS